MTDDLAQQVAEKLGWEQYLSTFIVDHGRDDQHIKTDHFLDSSCWHCAGLVAEEMGRKGYFLICGEMLVGEAEDSEPEAWARFDPCKTNSYSREIPTAIFAAALEALGEAP